MGTVPKKLDKILSYFCLVFYTLKSVNFITLNKTIIFKRENLG